MNDKSTRISLIFGNSWRLESRQHLLDTCRLNETNIFRFFIQKTCSFVWKFIISIQHVTLSTILDIFIWENLSHKYFPFLTRSMQERAKTSKIIFNNKQTSKVNNHTQLVVSSFSLSFTDSASNITSQSYSSRAPTTTDRTTI